MNNDNKPTAVRNHHRTPPFPIRVHLPASADTVGGRFHAALETGPLRYKLGVDAYRLRQNARQTISDRQTGDVHHDMHPVWPDAELENLGGYAQVLVGRGRSTVGATVRVDREQARVGQVTSWFAQNAMPAYALHEAHGHFHCVTAHCMAPTHGHTGGHGTGGQGTMQAGGHGMPQTGGPGMGHGGGHGGGAATLVPGDRFARANTNVSAAANASLRLTDNWLVTLGAGRAVRNPSVLERYADRFPAVKFQTAAEFVGNPHLVPEKSLELNAGTMFRAAQATMTLDVFLRNVRRLHHGGTRSESAETPAAESEPGVPLRAGGRRALRGLRPDRELRRRTLARSASGLVVRAGRGQALRRTAFRRAAVRAAVRPSTSTVHPGPTGWSCW